MRKSMTWKQTKATAKADATLCGIVQHIVETNRAGCRDHNRYLIFRDRVEELGLYIPNEAYYSILFNCLVK